MVAASNKNLVDEIKSGSFRNDLFYRLNVIPLEVPPLRERVDDIPLLVRYFLHEYSSEYGQKAKTIEEEALTLFVSYAWPGNVRELRNFIERLIIMAPGPVLTVRDVPPPVSGAPADGPQQHVGSTPQGPAQSITLRDARSVFEREFITRKLREFGGNVSRTADAIGVERSNLHRKIKALGIEIEG